jgi:hypothetical protein
MADARLKFLMAEWDGMGEATPFQTIVSQLVGGRAETSRD